MVLTVNSLGNAQTYLDVIQSNVDLFRGIIPAISHYSQNTVLLVASHPGMLDVRCSVPRLAFSVA